MTMPLRGAADLTGQRSSPACARLHQRDRPTRRRASVAAQPASVEERVATHGAPLYVEDLTLRSRAPEGSTTDPGALARDPLVELERVGQLLESSLEAAVDPAKQAAVQRRLARAQARQREQLTYKVSAIAATGGILALAIGAVTYRFWWHMRDGADFPVAEAAATLLLTGGGAIGMEMWARYAHKALWHDYQPGWALHKSHHEPRLGPFEANDVFAVANALPAMALCAYGFLTPSLFGGVCFGAGLGVTLFGMAYMFIHDGFVHRRFPVGPIADVPYLKRVAVAHQLHHSEKYKGVPWGLFLGPQELEAVGAKDELDRLCQQLDSKQRRK